MKKRYLRSLYFLKCTETSPKIMGGLTFLMMASLFVLLSFSSSTTYAQNNGFNITEDFKGNIHPGITLGGNAYLTSGVTDITNKLDDEDGDGWLRLTNAALQQAGYAVVNQSFPTDLGFLLDLEFVTWGGNGADGFSFFLFDSQYAPSTGNFRIGAPGDALGYSFRLQTPGLKGGYIGVGVDEYGFYGTTEAGKNGGFDPTTIRRPNSIALRGPEKPLISDSYVFLGGTKDIPTKLAKPGFKLDYRPLNQPNFRPDENAYYRRIILEAYPVDVGGGVINYRITTKIKTDINGTFDVIMDPILVNDLPPALLNLGFAAATGAQTHIHEVRNVMITTPTGVRVFKHVDKRRAYVGDTLEYKIDVFNHSPDNLTNLKFSDILPSEFQPSSIIFEGFGNPANTASGYTNEDLSDVTVGLAGFSQGQFTVVGTITGAPADGWLRNTANFDANGQTPDPNQLNDTFTVKTEILDPKLLLEKSGIYVDSNGDNRVNVGDQIEYTFKITNIGNMKIGDITLTDPLPGIIINGGPLDLIVGESNDNEFTAIYNITQADIDAGGVYNQATATGKDRLNKNVVVTSVDPNPLLPGDPGYDPRIPDHTFVPLEVGLNVVITNPNIYQKVKGN